MRFLYPTGHFLQRLHNLHYYVKAHPPTGSVYSLSHLVRHIPVFKYILVFAATDKNKHYKIRNSDSKFLSHVDCCWIYSLVAYIRLKLW